MFFLIGKKSEEKICLRTSCHLFSVFRCPSSNFNCASQSPQLTTTNPLPCYLQKRKNATTPLPVPFQRKKKHVSLCLSLVIFHPWYFFPPCFPICFRLEKQTTKLTCDRCSKRWRLIKASSTVCKASRPGGNSSAGTPCT